MGTTEQILEQLLKSAANYQKMLDEDGEPMGDAAAMGQMPAQMDPAAMGGQMPAQADPAAVDPGAAAEEEVGAEQTVPAEEDNSDDDDSSVNASASDIANAIEDAIEKVKKNGRKMEIKLVIEQALEACREAGLLEEAKATKVKDDDKKADKNAKGKKNIEIDVKFKPTAKDKKKYQALKFKKAKGEKLTKEEKGFIKMYEISKLALEKFNNKKINESLIDAVQLLGKRLSDLEEQTVVEKELRKQINESRWQEEAMETRKSLNDKAKKKLSSLYENADCLVKTGKTLTESKQLSYYRNIMNESANMISAISEASSKAVDNYGYTKTSVDMALQEQQAIETLDNLSAIFEEKIQSDKLDKINEALDIALNEASEFSGQDDSYGTIGGEAQVGSNLPKAVVNHYASSSRGSEFSDDDNYQNISTSVIKLPVMSNSEQRGLSLSSAMSNLAESFTHDGVLDVDGVAPAFLFCSKPNPKTIQDFKFPIATIQEGEMVLVPGLVKTAANILNKPDVLATFYKIPLTEHEVLRERLRPYLTALEMEIPWEA